MRRRIGQQKKARTSKLGISGEQKREPSSLPIAPLHCFVETTSRKYYIETLNLAILHENQNLGRHLCRPIVRRYCCSHVQSS